MSLSVISSPLAAIAPPLPGGTGTAGNTGTGVDFSALLFSQMGILSGVATESGRETGKETATSEEETETGSDALALFLGNLPPQPPVAPPPQQAASQQAGLVTEEKILAARSGSTAAQLPVELSGSNAATTETDANTANIAASNSFSDLLTPKGESNQLASHAAAQLQAAQSGKPEAAATHQASIQTPVSQPGWGHEFGEKLVWMAKNDQQSAQININPPQLGPIQIHLSLNGDQATASFASPFGEVRQAIESALPQLKEMLASSGIDLGQANVGANLAQQQREAQQQQAKTRRDSDENAILPATSDHASSGTIALGATGRGPGKVDLFA
ncbi:flagellar hook-length control protein FliK [Dechloromonas sp. ZY10]|uniref:flagellar hook-length control protein FliK n=1 Tax=Dechloromonas aquae TaxID=2664436 RepID=UPI003527C8A9